MGSLKGKVAIVTGASSGVGWLAAKRLGEAGAKLCVTARRKDALDKLVEELRAKKIACIAVTADVTKPDEVEAVVKACVERFGRVDILVNNAAVQAYGYFDALPWEQIARIFDVTCFGYFRFARAVLPHFRQQQSGHIINVLSMLSKGAAPLLSAYTSAKHALLGWHKTLKLELKGTGIELSGVLVPSVSTPMFDHAPSQFGLAPQPVPPTYDTDVAAKAVLRCARRPGRLVTPVFLQGKLILLMDLVAPWLGNAVLSRFGARMQMRERAIDRPEGNLYEPTAQGVGPYGSVKATAAWKRWIGGAAVLGAMGGAVGGAVYGARGAARALRS